MRILGGLQQAALHEVHHIACVVRSHVLAQLQLCPRLCQADHALQLARGDGHGVRRAVLGAQGEVEILQHRRRLGQQRWEAVAAGVGDVDAQQRTGQQLCRGE